MPILQNILLGVFVGQYITFAKVDSVWWPYLGADLNSLKSKVPLTARSNSASFYKSMHESAYNFDYFMLASLILLVLSFVGGVVQYKGARRILNALSLVTIAAAVGVELVFSRDLVSRILHKSGGKLIENLYWLSIYHGGTLACLLLTVFFQISTESDEDGEEEVVEKVKKSTKKTQ